MSTLVEEPVTQEHEETAEPLLDTEPAHKSAGSPGEELRRVITICERAAQGDLEARITHIDPNSDFGRLCRAINHMLDIADSFVREAAAAMEYCSKDHFHRPILLRGLKGAYLQSASVINQAGLKMQESNTRFIATAGLAAETASSLTTISAACEELNASNAEILRQTAESARQTESAVNHASHAGDDVHFLSDATRKIESIATLINTISRQTNLLALNATIEAARAGEHGRGFAVVANEVKELARSSAKATEDIGQQITAIQSKASDVATVIESINNSIQNINHGAANIAASVREQVQATNDISQNIMQASQATSEISANMNTL